MLKYIQGSGSFRRRCHLHVAVTQGLVSILVAFKTSPKYLSSLRHELVERRLSGGKRQIVKQQRIASFYVGVMCYHGHQHTIQRFSRCEVPACVYAFNFAGSPLWCAPDLAPTFYQNLRVNGHCIGFSSQNSRQRALLCTHRTIRRPPNSSFDDKAVAFIASFVEVVWTTAYPAGVESPRLGIVTLTTATDFCNAQSSCSSVTRRSRFPT